MTSTDVAVVFSLLENKEKEDSLLGEKRFIDERVTELENSIKVRMPFTALQLCCGNLFHMHVYIFFSCNRFYERNAMLSVF